MRGKQKKYRMDEPSAWDSPWTLLLILALLCIGVGLWLSARGNGWTGASLRPYLERAVGDPAARSALAALHTAHDAEMANLKAEFDARAKELGEKIQVRKRENARLVAEIQKRSATP